MDIFKILKQKENRQIPVINITILIAKPMIVSAPVSAKKAYTKGTLLSYFDTNHPDMGSPAKELMGINSSTVPNSASLKSKYVFMLGILDAHVEKQTPDIKKKRLKKNLCLFFKFMGSQIRVLWSNHRTDRFERLYNTLELPAKHSAIYCTGAKALLTLR
jgi:hypothetical protein